MSLSTQVLSWAISLSIVAILASRYRRLSSIPGPFLASFTDLWRAYDQNRGSFSSTLARLHEKYGLFVRVGPNTVSVGDPAAVSTIYSMHGEFKKAESYHTLRVFANGAAQGSMIDMDDEGKVTALRRAVGGMFATKNMLDYEDDVEMTAAMLIERILKIRTIDLFQTLQQFQVDYLMKIAFSEKQSFLETGRDTFSLSSHPRFAHWAQWQSMPILEHFLFKSPLLCKFQSSRVPMWAQMSTQKLRHRQAAKTPPEAQMDLLDKYLDAADKHKNTVDSDTIKRMISSTISAGFDTTAFTMTTMIYFLLKNPPALVRLQQELEAAIASGQLSDPPKFQETDKLEYLGAVVKESMRCYPFLALLLERIVPDGGATIAGKWFPGGTIVGCHPGVVHQSTDCFGDDAAIFRPERWLTENSDKRIAMERASLGFGSGKRICIGRHIAELEVKKVIPSLLLKFKMSFKDPNTILEPMDNLTSFPKPIFVTFDERT